MNPPIVYEDTKPTTHSTIRTTAIAHNMRDSSSAAYPCKLRWPVKNSTTATTRMTPAGDQPQ
jgi:hypothetical protein